MSTRCQVKVVNDSGDGVMLYHHWDGYPEGMVPLFVKARELCKGNAGTVGHLASFLCAAHPEGFEPEAGFDLHGDIEYLYIIHQEDWSVEVYGSGDFEKFMNEPEIKNLGIIHKRQPLDTLMTLVAEKSKE